MSSYTQLEIYFTFKSKFHSCCIKKIYRWKYLSFFNLPYIFVARPYLLTALFILLVSINLFLPCLIFMITFFCNVFNRFRWKLIKEISWCSCLFRSFSIGFWVSAHGLWLSFQISPWESADSEYLLHFIVGASSLHFVFLKGKVWGFFVLVHQKCFFLVVQSKVMYSGLWFSYLIKQCLR